jgi:hypothetical protein
MESHVSSRAATRSSTLLVLCVVVVVVAAVVVVADVVVSADVDVVGGGVTVVVAGRCTPVVVWADSALGSEVFGRRTIAAIRRPISSNPATKTSRSPRVSGTGSA